MSDRDGTDRVWIYGTDGRSARPVTPSERPVDALAWAPAGGWLAYGSAGRLWLVHPDTGASRELPVGEAVRLGAWTGDGHALLTTTAHGILLVPADGSPASHVATPHGRLAISDVRGDTALLVRQLDRTRDELLLVDVGRGAVSTVLDGSRPGTLHDARFVSGGAHGRPAIAVRTDLARDRMGLLRLAPHQGGWLIQGRIERDGADLEAWARLPSDGLLLSWNVDAISRLELRGAGPATERAWPDQVVLHVASTADSALLCASGAPDRPSTLWVGSPDAQRWRELRTGAADSVAGLGTVEPQRVCLRSGDGLRFDAWWYVPRGWAPGGPAVLSFHGGPAQQERPLFNATHQVLAHCGIAVLAPNVRGSSGRGRWFAALDDGTGRRGCLDDVDACVSWLGTTGGAGNLGVFGVSYGGLLALHAVARWPERISAAATLSAIADLTLFFNDTNDWMRTASAVEYGDPVRDAQLLRELSPVHALPRCAVPVLVVHGTRDDNVPPSQAQAVYAVLSHPASRLVLFADEGHGIHRPDNKVVFNEEIARWFRGTLGGT